MLSPQTLDHFQNPRNSGQVASPDSTVQLTNPACGDILKLTLKLSAGPASEARIEDIRFLAQGCVPSIACASALTELVRGQTIPAARAFTRDQLIQAVGGLPRASTHAAQLALDTLTAALAAALAKPAPPG